jgi:hypothetical protein
VAPNDFRFRPMKSQAKSRSLALFTVIGLAASALAAALTATAAEPAPQFSPDDVALFIDQHCATCHNDTDKEKDLDITALKFNPQDPKNVRMWRKIYDQTESGEMPPKEKRRPRPAALKEFLGKLGPALEAAESK